MEITEEEYENFSKLITSSKKESPPSVSFIPKSEEAARSLVVHTDLTIK